LEVHKRYVTGKLGTEGPNKKGRCLPPLMCC
jgi:hypothetical protein